MAGSGVGLLLAFDFDFNCHFDWERLAGLGTWKLRTNEGRVG